MYTHYDSLRRTLSLYQCFPDPGLIWYSTNSFLAHLPKTKSVEIIHYFSRMWSLHRICSLFPERYLSRLMYKDSQATFELSIQPAWRFFQSQQYLGFWWHNLKPMFGYCNLASSISLLRLLFFANCSAGKWSIVVKYQLSSLHHERSNHTYSSVFMLYLGFLQKSTSKSTINRNSLLYAVHTRSLS